MADMSSAKPVRNGSDADVSDSETLSAEEEGKEIDRIEAAYVPAVGEEMFLLRASWWKHWMEYTGFRQDLPGDKDKPLRDRPLTIDNYKLMKKQHIGQAASVLKPDLKEEDDYVLVSKGSWEQLQAWYGGGPAISRPVVAINPSVVSVYGISLQVYHSATPSTCRSISIDLKATVRDLKRKACEAFSLAEDNVVMYDYFKQSKNSMLETNPDKPLHEMRLVAEQAILLQDKDSNEDGEVMDVTPSSLWDDPPKSKPYVSSYDTRYSRSTMTSYEPEDTCTAKFGGRPGLAGLSNLGNTCFMNSSLQCLAHTVPLMQSFLSGQYERDLNKANPLGTGGELAQAFGSLMQKLWKGDVSYVSPRSFKAKVGKHAPQFSGYQQHDSQEFLEFVLDKLHEDIDRHKSKPYIEEKDAGDRQDEDIAQEAWGIYKARNDSFIVDHFQGLYKSTLDCPNCGARGRKFDPIMYLSLPLPNSRIKTLTYSAIFMDGSHPPLELSLEVAMVLSIGEMFEAIRRQLIEAQLIQEPSVAMQDGAEAPVAVKAADVMQALLVKNLGYPTNKLLSLKDRVADVRLDGGERLWVYVYPSPECGPNSGRKLVVLNQKRPVYNNFMKSFGVPLRLWVPEEALGRDSSHLISTPKDRNNVEFLLSEESPLYREVLQVLRPFRTPQAVAAEEAAAAAGTAATDTEAPAAAAHPTEVPAASDADDTLDPPGTPPREPPPVSTLPTTAPVHPLAAGLENAVLPQGGTWLESSSMEVERPAQGDALQIGGGSSSIAVPVIAPPPPAVGVPVVQPFDMWSAQSSAQTAPTDTASGTSPGVPRRPPLVIKLANSPTSTTFWTQTKVQLADALEKAEFCLEWNEAAEGVYDARAMEAPQRHESSLAAIKALSTPKPVTLQACMETFLQPEQLGEQDTWRCTGCKEFVQATKKLDLWTLPEVLVIVLKRFSYTRYHRDKLDTHVAYPVRGFDVSPYVLKPQTVPPIYDLYAVINHYGGLGGGHYTAYAQMPGEEQWYSFDDSSVSPMREEQVVTSSGYVLFYRRRHEANNDPPDLVEGLIQEVRKADEAAEALAAKTAAAAAAAPRRSPPPQPPLPSTSTAVILLPSADMELDGSAAYGDIPPQLEVSSTESDTDGKAGRSFGGAGAGSGGWPDAPTTEGPWQSDAEDESMADQPKRMPAIGPPMQTMGDSWGMDDDYDDLGSAWRSASGQRTPERLGESTHIPADDDFDDLLPPNSPAGQDLELMSTSD